MATVPWSTYYGYSYAQQILTKANINADAAGNITGLKFYLGSSAAITNSNEVVVYLGLTNKASFSSTTDWIPTTALTQVFAGTVTNNAGVVEITFPTPFPYDNVNNLVIAIDENKADDDGGERFYTYSNGSNKTLYYRSDSTNPNPASITQTGSLSSTQSVVTLLGLALSPVPLCPTVSAPSAAATGVSVTPAITWGAITNATGYRLSIGTTAGGTDVMNNVDVGNVVTYTPATPLNYNKQYFYTVNAYNGSLTSPGCSERSFTTLNIPCPSVSAPASAATGVSVTPTITWGAVTGATGYKLKVGTTAGGSEILNNADLGNVTSYTFASPLLNGTKYYYTVNSYDATAASASCTERNFTTVCGVITPAYTNDFATFPGICWSLANGGTPATGPGTGTTNYWISDGFLNVGSSGAAKMNLYSTGRNGWLKSPAFNLSAGGYRVKFNYGVTAYDTTTASVMGSDDIVQFLVSVDGGTTWEVLNTWNAANAPGNTSNIYTFDLSNYVGANTVFAIYGSDGAVNDDPDYDFFVDNFTVEAIPACDIPTSVNHSAVTESSATISWVAPSAAPANGYQYYYSTTNTAPASGTLTTATTQNLSPLQPQTTYYYWVRSMCSGAESAWVSGTFKTLATPPANDNCSSAVDLVVGGNFAQHSITGTTAGATNTPALTASCLFTPTNVAGNVWYRVVVPASGNLTLETDTTTGTTLEDTVMSVFADCNTTTSIACNDDGGNGSFSKISLTGQTPGTTLYVSVWRYSSSGGGADGEFKVSAYDASLLATSEVSAARNDLKAYPNPFTDVLNISDISKVKSVSIVDLAGRVVKTIDNPSSALQLGDLKQGMYLVTLNLKDGSKQTIKAIKK